MAANFERFAGWSDSHSMDETTHVSGLSPDLIDPELPTPLYHQVYLVLREKIRRGEIPKDATLPGEQELSQSFNVSRITVKRALNDLAADGLVTRHRGRGTIVAQGTTIPVVKGSFDTLIESLHIMGLETEVELLEVTKVAASGIIAEQLDVPPGTPLQRATRLRKLQGEPFSHLVTYIPGNIAAKFSVKQLSSTPLLTLLERAGAPPYEAEQWITATAAEPSIAAALDVSPGAPLLKIERIMRGPKAVPVQLIHAHYRPDRFQYHVKTHRRRTGDAGVWRDEH
jgi:GntR family transcriptional regulator